MTQLADFINHGILPFSGRKGERERIAAFLRTDDDRDTIRVLLVGGEGGVGKSRLIEESLAGDVPEGTIMLHLKIAPGGTGSVCRLAADALWAGSAVRRLLREQPEPSVGGVATALARCARLRPTLLVIEDLHLLEGGTLREFGLLLDAIDEEPLALLAAARTGELPARGLLQRLALEELHLDGLSRELVGSLWQALFGAPPSEEILELLISATAGNPLALRSALRAAIHQDALVESPPGVWRIEPPFAAITRRNARSIADGMTAHLARDLKQKAGMLAGLGELFSREAAEILVEPALVDDFIFDGILFELERAKPPLPMLPRSALPVLGFTHSLLHRQLAERNQLPLTRIIEVIAARTPLYSVLPLTSIVGRAGEVDDLEAIELPIIRSALAVLFDVAVEIDRTPDWALALPSLEAAEQLLEWNRERFAETYPLLRAGVVARRLDLLRRTMDTPAYAEALEELGAITADPSTIEMAQLRLFTISFLLWSKGIDENSAFEEFVAMIARFEALRAHRFYAITLRDFAQIAESVDNTPLRRRIEEEYDRIDRESPLYPLARRHVAPNFLTLFETPEELERRLELYRELSADAQENTVLSTSEPFFLWSIARIDEMKRVVEATIPGLRERGLLRTLFSRHVLLLRAQALLGLPLEEFMAECRRIQQEQIAAGILDNPRLPLEPVMIAAIVGDDTWLDAARESLREQPPEALGILTGTPSHHLVLRNSSGIVGGDRALPLRICRIEQIAELRLLLRSSIEGGDTAGWKPLATSLRGALEWLEERRLPAVMKLLLGEGDHLLEEKERAAWTKKVTKLEAERKRESSRGAPAGESIEESGTVVTMLGKIEVRRPGEAEPLQPRGARQKSFLGAMIAGEMLARPLGREEFMEAAGLDPTDGKASRDGMNSAIYRLRELVGADAILTDGAIPRLNPEIVRCDLVEAHRYLRNALEASRRGDLRRGDAALFATLQLSRGEVPFPTLYESLFELLRDEFETRLRSVVLDIGSRLIEEGDGVGAERTLALASSALAGDDDVTLLYCRALELCDRRAEAELLRARMEKDL